MKLCPFCKNPVTKKGQICERPECQKKQKRMDNFDIILIPEGYVTTSMYAKEHGLTVQTITKYCRIGLLKEAWQDKFSGRWYIPKDLETPIPATGAAHRRTVRHRLKVTEKEYNLIKEAAATKQMTVNEYLIWCVLENS